MCVTQPVRLARITAVGTHSREGRALLRRGCARKDPRGPPFGTHDSRPHDSEKLKESERFECPGEQTGRGDIESFPFPPRRSRPIAGKTAETA